MNKASVAYVVRPPIDDVELYIAVKTMEAAKFDAPDGGYIPIEARTYSVWTNEPGISVSVPLPFAAALEFAATRALTTFIELQIVATDRWRWVAGPLNPNHVRPLDLDRSNALDLRHRQHVHSAFARIFEPSREALWLQDLREQLDWSVDRLASVTGIDPTEIERFEDPDAVSTLSASQLVPLACVLGGLSPTSLTDVGEDDRPPLYGAGPLGHAIEFVANHFPEYHLPISPNPTTGITRTELLHQVSRCSASLLKGMGFRGSRSTFRRASEPRVFETIHFGLEPFPQRRRTKNELRGIFPRELRRRFGVSFVTRYELLQTPGLQVSVPDPYFTPKKVRAPFRQELLRPDGGDSSINEPLWDINDPEVTGVLVAERLEQEALAWFENHGVDRMIERLQQPLWFEAGDLLFGSQLCCLRGKRSLAIEFLQRAKVSTSWYHTDTLLYDEAVVQTYAEQLKLDIG